MSLATRTRIVVTGAASGIGAQLCQRLRAQGVDVLALDLQPNAGGISCDLSNPQSIAAAAASIEGQIDGIAHVAGLPGTASSEQIAAVNIVALRRLTSHLADRLKRGGAIVVVSSVTAHRCDWPSADVAALLGGDDQVIIAKLGRLSGADAYAASKRLANSWASTLSAELLSRDVRVNVVSPGPVETPILKDFEKSMGASRLQAAADIVGRHGHPDEIAAVIVFLLSSDASWLNGVNVACDGGFSNARAVAAEKIGFQNSEEQISCS